MKNAQHYRILIAVFMIFSLVACAGGEKETTNQPAAVEGVVLEIVGLEESKYLTVADLQDLTQIQGWGGTKSSAGVITPPQHLKGVSLIELTDLVGGLAPGMGISVVAKDGYGMTMSYEQIVGGDFITYDPGTGFENQAEGSLTAIVAYQRDGEFLSSDEDGPLRLFVISDKNDNVVDGHWTVKWVSQIRLKPMSEEWSLYLEGALTEQMDRNSFESCSAPGCHQASWTDEDGNNWSGVPIYYLAGRVDDAIIHEGRAYNDDFAQAGYSIEIFAGDGTNVSIESSLTDFNRHILVASTVNGDPLDDEYFPLRLVGEGLEKNEMIGALAQIILRPNEGVELPSGEVISEEDKPGEVELVLPENAALMILGDIMNPLTLGMGNLKAMNLVEIEIEHPKSGLQTYQGIRLNDLLNLAGVGVSATQIIVTSADGYVVQIALDEVQNCTDCLLALSEDDGIILVMPGMESNFWAKDVNFLEIK